MLQHEHCFACGPKQTVYSLQLSFEQTSNFEVQGHFWVGPEYQSYDGILHGGIVSTLLDAAMTNCLLKLGIKALTADLHIRFIAPVTVGQTIHMKATILKHRRHVYFMESSLWSENTELAKAAAFFMEQHQK